MIAEHVKNLADEVWQERAEGRLCRDAGELSRRLYLTLAEEREAIDQGVYDPEADVKVKWLREVIYAMRASYGRLQTAGDMAEELVAWALGKVDRLPCGRELAVMG